MIDISILSDMHIEIWVSVEMRRYALSQCLWLGFRARA